MVLIHSFYKSNKCLQGAKIHSKNWVGTGDTARKEMKSPLSWNMGNKQVVNKVISNEVPVVETMEQGMFMSICL